MFTKTAGYYDALYYFKDYKNACNQLHHLIQSYNNKAKTLLDVACGTGKHIQYLREVYDAEGLDLNPELLAVARNRCPEAVFHEADMTNFNLYRTYDAVVCLFSSIGYVCTVENLYKTIQQMANHLKSGGILLIEPWITPENYWVDRVTANFVDQPDLKIAWMYTSKKKNLTSIFDIHYMVGTPDGVDNFTEQHVMGLWTDDEYRQAFLNVGIQPVYDSQGFFGRGMYYGVKD